MLLAMFERFVIPWLQRLKRRHAVGWVGTCDTSTLLNRMPESHPQIHGSTSEWLIEMLPGQPDELGRKEQEVINGINTIPYRVPHLNFNSLALNVNYPWSKFDAFTCQSKMILTWKIWYTPIVVFVSLNRLSVNCSNKLDFPTPLRSKPYRRLFKKADTHPSLRP